jgi:hypothetical protein
MNKKQEQEQAAAEIMHMFRYFYKDEWAPENIFDGKTRAWIQVFNSLIKQGMITRRKSHNSYEYKWAGVFPENY